MHLSEQHKKRISEAAKKRWANPEFKKMVSKRMKRAAPKPVILCMCGCGEYAKPGNKYIWEFVGDGKIVINGKCPDFINVNGQKKIIELFGERWHEEDEEKERQKVFEPFGHDTLIIWVKELSSLKKLKHKLEAFCFNRSVTAPMKGGSQYGT